MLKTWPFPRTVCVCVCACWWWGGGGRGQDVITIRTSLMTPLSASVSRLSTARGVGGGGGVELGAVVTNAFYSYNARVGICVRYITMEMSTGVK